MTADGAVIRTNWTVMYCPWSGSVVARVWTLEVGCTQVSRPMSQPAANKRVCQAIYNTASRPIHATNPRGIYPYIPVATSGPMSEAVAKKAGM